MARKVKPWLPGYLGRVLKEERLKQDVSQSELATGLDFSTSYVSEVENGVKLPSLEFLILAADYLSVDIAQFFPALPEKGA